ncbi:hypothetical protein CsSME_00046821 [Camellia sinensis var. sinensis]
MLQSRNFGGKEKAKRGWNIHDDVFDGGRFF